MKRIARWIVSKYPAAWRERYAAEVLDLIDTGPVTAHEAGELFRAMLVERVRAGIDVERPEEAVARLTRLKTITVAVGWVFSLVTGVLLRWWRPMTETEAAWIALCMVGYAVVLLCLWVRHRSHVARTGDHGRAAMPVVVAIVCIAAQLGLGGAYWWLLMSSPMDDGLRGLRLFNALYSTAYCGAPLVWLLTQVWPGQKLVGAIVEFEAARQSEAGARYFVASCEEWIAKGVPSPLIDAQSSLAEATTKREAALARLKAVGYRLPT